MKLLLTRDGVSYILKVEDVDFTIDEYREYCIEFAKVLGFADTNIEKTFN